MKINALASRMFFLGLLISISLLHFGCKKNQQKTLKQDLLTEHLWKYAGYISNPATNPPEASIIKPVADCEKDDILRFDPNGTVFIYRDAQKCDINEAERSTENYSLDLAKKKLVLSGLTYDVFELSENELKLGLPVQGQNYKYIITVLAH